MYIYTCIDIYKCVELNLDDFTLNETQALLHNCLSILTKTF